MKIVEVSSPPCHEILPPCGSWRLVERIQSLEPRARSVHMLVTAYQCSLINKPRCVQRVLGAYRYGCQFFTTAMLLFTPSGTIPSSVFRHILADMPHSSHCSSLRIRCRSRLRRAGFLENASSITVRWGHAAPLCEVPPPPRIPSNLINREANGLVLQVNGDRLYICHQGAEDAWSV